VSTRAKLLFTGGGGAGSEALSRLLGGRYDAHFADADPDARPYGVPATAWHPVPMASAPNFLDALSRLCADLGTDLLIPGVDEELSAIAGARDALRCEILLPPARFVETHLDKLASHRALHAAAVTVPETEMLDARQRVTFPCIVKPRRGRGSRDVAMVESDEQLRAHLVHCRRPAADFIVQERLDGQEYTVTMVADRAGELRAIVPVKVGFKRGITIRAETDRDEAVIAACAAIHRAQPVGGCFNIQLVKMADGAVKPFEINPRISTTTCLAYAAGVDFIGLYLGGDAPTDGRFAAFENHLQLKRSWHNEFVAAAGPDR
jgi:carbamoyl-phosphate synthase large subunit